MRTSEASPLFVTLLSVGLSANSYLRMKTPGIPAIDDVLMRRDMAGLAGPTLVDNGGSANGPWVPHRTRKPLGTNPSSLALLVLFVMGSLLAGCATEDPSKPWEKDKKKWYQSDMDSGDRAFYHSFFFGN